MNLIFDNIEGARWENSVGMSSLVRVGKVTGITGRNRDPAIIIKALAAQGMPQLRERHPIIPNLYVSRQVVTGMSGDSCRVEVHYENPQWGMQEMTYAISDSTGLQNESVNVDANWQLLKGDYKPSGGTKQSYIATVNRLTPMRQIAMTWIQRRRPGDTIAKWLGYVNLNPWNGYPKGYWLFAGIDGNYDNSSRKYTVTAKFITKCWVNWGACSTYISPLTGKPPDDAEAPTASWRDYSFGQKKYNGNLWIGFYPMTNFNLFLPDQDVATATIETMQAL